MRENIITFTYFWSPVERGKIILSFAVLTLPSLQIAYLSPNYFPFYATFYAIFSEILCYFMIMNCQFYAIFYAQALKIMLILCLATESTH